MIGKMLSGELSWIGQVLFQRETISVTSCLLLDYKIFLKRGLVLKEKKKEFAPRAVLVNS